MGQLQHFLMEEQCLVYQFYMEEWQIHFPKLMMSLLHKQVGILCIILILFSYLIVIAVGTSVLSFIMFATWMITGEN